MMRYKIGKREFSTKNEVETQVKSILNDSEYNHNQPISGKDFKIVYSLLENHPRAEEKIGAGVKEIIINNDGYGHRCFYLIRKDGSRTDFSYKKCIYPPNKRTEMLKACRNAILPQKLKFKQENEKSSNLEQVVHHETAFKKMVDNWMEENNLRLEDIRICGYGDSEKERYIKNPKLRKSFCNYHKKYAKLALMPAGEHRRMKR